MCGSLLRTDEASKDVGMFVRTYFVITNSSVPAGEQFDDNRIRNNAYVLLSTIFHPSLNLEITKNTAKTEHHQGTCCPVRQDHRSQDL